MNIPAIMGFRLAAPNYEAAKQNNISKFGLRMSSPLQADTVSFRGTPKLANKQWEISKETARAIRRKLASSAQKVESFMQDSFGDLVASEKYPKNPLSEIGFRLKSIGSIAEKTGSRQWSSVDEILTEMTDLIGAKLVFRDAARNKVDAVNTPGKEEFQQWPKNLQEQVTKAFKEGGAKSKDNEKEKDEEKKTSKPKTGAERITELRQKIGELEKAEQAAKAAGGKLEEKDKYAILGLTKEEIEIRKLRGQAQKGDIKAQIEVDKRRHKTMTDEYKYEREVELDDKGQPKKDENGKPVYKRDKDGNFVYKTNEKGQKIKTAAYQAFYNRVKANQGKGSK